MEKDPTGSIAMRREDNAGSAVHSQKLRIQVQPWFNIEANKKITMISNVER